MADFADRASQYTEEAYERRDKKSYEIPTGKKGDCDTCGEWSSRLIGGMCAPCRDKYGLK